MWFQLFGSTGRRGIGAASDEDSAASLEGLLLGFAAFVSLDSLAECGIFSGDVDFHSRCFMGIQNVGNS